MNYKIEGALKRNKNRFIICAILWLILVIVFVAPFACSKHQAGVNGSLIEHLSVNIKDPFGSLGRVFSEGAMQEFGSTLLIFTIFYLVVFFVGVSKSAPKNEYTDIEHGSSDWSQRGEQYKILSKNEGIILAENNYLPLDKRGNVNVLVVGRFRFW